MSAVAEIPQPISGVRSIRLLHETHCDDHLAVNRWLDLWQIHWAASIRSKLEFGHSTFGNIIAILSIPAVMPMIMNSLTTLHS